MTNIPSFTEVIYLFVSRKHFQEKPQKCYSIANIQCTATCAKALNIINEAESFQLNNKKKIVYREGSKMFLIQFNLMIENFRNNE
jgi:hypothetical protein